VKSQLQIWRANFFTGLAVVLPVVLTLIILKWGFGTITGITDSLLFFVPREITHADGGRGPTYWYWSLASFALALVLIAAVGRATRYYVGKRVIFWMDQLLRRVPLLNKIYTTIQQVNEAFTSSTRSSFKQVVLIQYPRQGIYSIGFLTSEELPEPEQRVGRALDGIFVPTTPNPTSGFLVMVPDEDVIRLNMSVADGIKYVISLGSIVPQPAAESARLTGVLPPLPPAASALAPHPPPPVPVP
jgi:uncharacterized membrane protein